MQEIDTDHQFRPTNICKHFSTFFLIKNVRIRVTTYLWERDMIEWFYSDPPDTDPARFAT